MGPSERAVCEGRRCVGVGREGMRCVGEGVGREGVACVGVGGLLPLSSLSELEEELDELRGVVTT